MKSMRSANKPHDNRRPSPKGQSAIEYLMNYAWAIALIIIVGIAIFQLNIGGIRNSLTSQSSQITQAGEQLAVVGYLCDSEGRFSVSVQNNGAGQIKDIYLNASNESSTVLTDCTGTPDIFPGQTQICRNTSTGGRGIRCGNVGQSYEIQVTVSYIDDVSGLTFKPSRNFTGTVQAG
ncbi:MAG: hypothetical protein HYS81_02795 [Candidatus Aenigmatarchaeota archaeon]|nr:MAG: hypothetical protein HYS81_02795 [Candidatus Aenigmarchaeota archaeon]